MKVKCFSNCSRFIIMLFLLLTISPSGQAQADKFLVVHLDAVSSQDFFRELEAGRLPNIQEIFKDGHMPRYGISLFPGGTEIIYPRLKEGLDNSQGNIIGWGRLDRETGKVTSKIETFLEIFPQYPRINRNQTLLALPVLRHLAGLSMLNFDRAWETSDALEFLWFNTDVSGHRFGRESHLKSLRLFDYYLGLAYQTGKLDGANIVIYCDHGMTTGDLEMIEHDIPIKQVLGEELLYSRYPHIYLQDVSRKEEFAQRISQETELEITVIRAGENLVRGYTAQGYFEITALDDKYKYSFVGEDFFAYESLALVDCYLTKEEWLNRTKDYIFPAVPPNLYGLLMNPMTGDLVLILNPPLIPKDLWVLGSHAGLRETDLMVPLMYTGEAFSQIEEFDEFWLHEIYSKHFPMIDFKPKHKEKSSLSIQYPLSGEIVYSPLYRLRGGLTVSKEALEPWVEYDLYSSYLARIWGGIAYSDQKIKWQIKTEAALGKLGVSWMKRQNSDGVFNVNLRLNEKVELKVGPNSAGLTISF